MTNKQQSFIAEYLKDYNATQAAIRAGYSEDSANVSGAKNLKNPEIRGMIKANIDEALANTKLSLQVEVLNKLYEIAMGEPDVRERDGEILEVSRRDKLRALELLGKHMTMFVDRKEIDIGLSDDAYAALKGLYGD